MTMPPEIRRRLFRIRCKGKQGQTLTEEETQFFKDCYRRWPEEYAAMTQEVFEATKPFGSL
jgi:hypothetical protein